MNPPGLALAAASDLGLRRQQNEDSHGLWVPDDADTRERRGVLLVVADGMGGALAGEVASRLAVQAVIRSYRESEREDVLADLHQALVNANHVVHSESLRSPELGGMGTTCTAAVVRGRELYIAHVGDSRLYLLRGDALRQLTRDHSLVAQMVRDGQITAEQARVDPRRNVVTRSVGVSAEVEVDADRLPEPLEPGDTLLLCSDGLHGVVPDEELAEFAASEDLEAGAARAIERANEHGGPDNITALLARLEGAASGPRHPAGRMDAIGGDPPPEAQAGAGGPTAEPMAIAATAPEAVAGPRPRSSWLVWLLLLALLIAVLLWAMWRSANSVEQRIVRGTPDARPAARASSSALG